MLANRVRKIDFKTIKIKNMGLDTTHNAWHGSYGAFNVWRTEIAKCIGIPLSLMEGFYPTDENGYGDPLSLVKYQINGQALDQFERHGKNFPLKWNAFKPNPLHELLYHSDCDGNIKWKKCKPIANELTKILSKLPDENFGGHIQDIKNKTKIFIKGLLLAYKSKENLYFK